MLHDVEGFDHKEVGRMLGIAEGTSKSPGFQGPDAASGAASRQ